MYIRYLKYVKKWCISYHGHAVAVGNSLADAINDAIIIIAK